MLAGHFAACLLIRSRTPGMFKAYAALAGLDDSKQDRHEAERRWQALVASAYVSWSDIEAVLFLDPHMGKALHVPGATGESCALRSTKARGTGSLRCTAPARPDLAGMGQRGASTCCTGRGRTRMSMRAFLKGHLRGSRFNQAWAQLLQDHPCLRPRS